MCNEEQPNSPHDSSRAKFEYCLKILPQIKRWTLIFFLIILGVMSALLVGFTISGHIIEIRSFECGRDEEDAALLQSKSNMVYGLMVPCFVASLIGLRGVLKNNTAILKLFAAMMLVLSFAAFVLFIRGLDTGAKMKADFKARYLDLMPLDINDTQQDCSYLQNIYRWQTEYKCCGLVDGYYDWGWGNTIPDSCLCDQGEDSSSTTACVKVLNSVTLSNEYKLVYEKPCLPVVLPHVRLRGSGMNGILSGLASILMGILGLSVDVCCGLKAERRRRRLEAVKVPVVYIRKRKTTTSTTTDDERDAAEGREEAKAGWGEEDECPMFPVTRDELKRLQEELDPPPYTAVYKCTKYNFGPFYVAHVDQDTPFPRVSRLIEGVDWAHMTPQYMENGHHVFLLPQPPGVNVCLNFGNQELL